MREELGAKTLIRDLKRDHFNRIKDMMAVLPPNATKTHPKLSFPQVAEVAKREGLTPMNVVTANNHLSLITTIFRFAHDEDLIDKNPARKLRITRPNTLRKGNGGCRSVSTNCGSSSHRVRSRQPVRNGHLSRMPNFGCHC